MENMTTVQLTEAQIDEIARRAAKYAVREEGALLLKCLRAFGHTGAKNVAANIEEIVRKALG